MPASACCSCATAMPRFCAASPSYWITSAPLFRGTIALGLSDMFCSLTSAETIALSLILLHPRSRHHEVFHLLARPPAQPRAADQPSKFAPQVVPDHLDGSRDERDDDRAH